jgi:hypothetical protein
MKRLNPPTTAADIDEVPQGPGSSHEDDPGLAPSDEQLLDSMADQAAAFAAKLAKDPRPELTDTEQQSVFDTIVHGMDTMDVEMGARVATATYNDQWFQAEPDLELRKSLAQYLLTRFGSSTSAIPTVWRKYA